MTDGNGGYGYLSVQLTAGKNASEDARAPANSAAAPAAQGPKGWHSRGYLPHLDDWSAIQFITYRLEDSLPAHVAHRLADELDPEHGDARYYRRVEAWLDAGHGSCLLRRAEIAATVRDSWLFNDGKRYHLHAWVVMPNHVHVLVQMAENVSLGGVVHDWKSFTSHAINRTTGRQGALWQRDYWDRFMRSEQHFEETLAYILSNPVKAGLARSVEEWPWVFPHTVVDLR